MHNFYTLQAYRSQRKPKLFLQCFIHTSHAVSLEIHGHVCKAIFFEGFHDLVAVLQDFLGFIRQHFNSCQCTMNTHTQLMKSQIQKQLLCFLSTMPSFSFVMVSPYTKREEKTGEGLFLPGGKVKVFGQGADVFVLYNSLWRSGLLPPALQQPVNQVCNHHCRPCWNPLPLHSAPLFWQSPRFSQIILSCRYSNGWSGF